MSFTRAVIFSGGNLFPESLQEIHETDYVIGADKGALFLVSHGVRPDLAVGDFDSVSQEERQQIEEKCGRMISCDPIHKDLTDTELALELAFEAHANEILMLGVTGTRLDHTLANIQMLIRAVQHHSVCTLKDPNNLITLTASTLTIYEQGYTYVSLLPLTAEVTGINLEGFMYPLENATLKMGQSLGVSNRLAGLEGNISIQSGLLLVIQSKD
ncbi:thiamine diphosphokinase [Paenibacillus sp. JX-17]|uniref:Thiamine diphosphokinase n=1 Tax=Paenibacillus lacisoli TaxID=3064525 RepID=A0ABT9C6M2_9BACL|nr:thiamine diphosphokinase [Paenibacillus sp. JX-17]MDO7904908.1 thiamine diphosphokinase [Paenibacillus sp. JX-17]